MYRKLKVAIIGAGPCGIASAKQFVNNENFHCDVYERECDIGGTWKLSDAVGYDTYGLPVHSSLYKNLRTNLPKEIMLYPDFPFPGNIDDSYLNSDQILQYLHQYVNHYDIKKLMKFNHYVDKVSYTYKNDWKVEVIDLLNNMSRKVINYDAIMICNGHFSAPKMPDIEGSKTFLGSIIHSHDYRDPEVYKGKTVLLIGAGPTALDLIVDLSKLVKNVLLSHHRDLNTQFPENITELPDVKHFTEDSAVFVNGIERKIDSVIYCTGYNLNFPFFDESCGVTINEEGVKPLYRLLININRPTMCFIGIPNHCVPFPLAHLQARYFVKLLEGKFKLPNREEMLAETEKDLKSRKDQGLVGSRLAHFLGPKQQQYYDLIAKEANIESIPPVVSDLHAESHKEITVCIIGSGAAGLVSARYLIENNINCKIYERQDNVGGTWRLSEEIGLDKYGLPVHSSMYNNLRTNLPKEIMFFPGHPIPNVNESYVKYDIVLKYLKDYANYFNLRKFINFAHLVKNVNPTENDKWNVETLNLKTNEKKYETFDAVMICNGHYCKPYKPKIEGQDVFRGIIIHSHDYRDPTVFKDQTILIIGSGPSGVDLTSELSSCAHKVVMSHHKLNKFLGFPNHVLQVSDVQQLTKFGAIFKDGTVIDHINAIILCTGYEYDFPFLDKSCGVNVTPLVGVEPLYRDLIHIERPTMCFLGLHYNVVPFPLLDLQARYFIEMLLGRFKLPSKPEMYKIASLNKTKRTHFLGEKQKEYFTTLAAEADIKRIPNVVSHLHAEIKNDKILDLFSYRENNFKVVNDETFERIPFKKNI